MLVSASGFIVERTSNTFIIHHPLFQHFDDNEIRFTVWCFQIFALDHLRKFGCCFLLCSCLHSPVQRVAIKSTTKFFHPAPPSILVQQGCVDVIATVLPHLLDVILQFEPVASECFSQIEFFRFFTAPVIDNFILFHFSPVLSPFGWFDFYVDFQIHNASIILCGLNVNSFSENFSRKLKTFSCQLDF